MGNRLGAWKKEHGEAYAVPEEIDALVEQGVFVDQSWHNDTCPVFDIFRHDVEGTGYALQLWVDHVDPEHREIEGFSRYMLGMHDDVHGGSEDDLYNGDDLREAFKVAAKTLKALGHSLERDSAEEMAVRKAFFALAHHLDRHNDDGSRNTGSEQFMDEVANECAELGLEAWSHHSGGGIYGVQIPRDGLVYFFGVADATWGADVSSEEDHLRSFSMALDSEEQDPAVVAKEIQKALANQSEAK